MDSGEHGLHVDHRRLEYLEGPDAMSDIPPCVICGLDIEDDDIVAYAEDGDPCHQDCYEEDDE